MTDGSYKDVPIWKARSTMGAPLLFESAEALQKACLEYFRWVEENPLVEAKVGFSYGNAIKADVPKMRAMTSSGLALFLGITHKTLIEWKKTRDDLQPVIEWAESIIWNQKFSGASAGMLNATIISRELGLADKQQIDANVPKMIVQAPKGEKIEQPPIHGE